MSESTARRNKAFVLEAFDTLFNKKDFVAAEKFWSSNYIQHSAHIPPGRDGLFGLVGSTPPEMRYENSLIMAEGDMLMLHGRFSGLGLPANWIVVDIVRIENGLLAEHWDVIEDEATRESQPVAFQCSARRFPPDDLASGNARRVVRGASGLARTSDRTTVELIRDLMLGRDRLTISGLLPGGAGHQSREKRENHMRAMRAEQFSGYEGLKLVELPKPAVTDEKVLVRITAAGVTPLDYTILSGNFHGQKPPLVLGNEGAGVVEMGGGIDFPAGSRVMFFGAYGAFENGTYSEWVAVRKEDLCLIPDNIDDVSAAGIPVAYLAAQVALTRAGFRAGKTVFAPAIGGSIGNAVTQLARAAGAKHAMSSTTNHAKAGQAKALGFSEVIDTSQEKLGDGVRRITSGYGADIVIDGIGGEVLSQALGALAVEGSLTTLGYSASRQTTIDVTNVIGPQTSVRGLNMFTQPKEVVAEAWKVIVSLLKSGAIKPIVAKTFRLADAAEALRYLIEGRPFGRVILTI